MTTHTCKDSGVTFPVKSECKGHHDANVRTPFEIQQDERYQYLITLIENTQKILIHQTQRLDDFESRLDEIEEGDY